MKAYTAFILTLIFAVLSFIGFILYKQVNQKSNTTPTTITNTVPLETLPTAENEIVEEMETLTEKEALGKISGKLCYPSEMIPELTVYIKNVDTKEYDFVMTVENQSTYEFANVSDGKYHVYAYLNAEDNDLGGGYTAAVACGLTVSCTNHELVDVEVLNGSSVEDIDVCDWYGAILPPKNK